MRTAFLAVLVEKKKNIDNITEMAKSPLLMAEEDDVTEKMMPFMFGDKIYLERFLQFSRGSQILDDCKDFVSISDKLL